MDAAGHDGQVDFAFGARDRLRTACQIARKRYMEGSRLVVYCSDSARLTAFDRLLWSFDDTSFIPHVLADDPLVADTPVVLTAGSPQAAREAMGPQAEPWLLNLDDACPPDCEAFARIMEVVSDDPLERQLARQRWRAYQAQGRRLQAHDLSRRS